MGLFRPESKFIQSQSKLVKFGESNFEAVPQICLQLFILMKTMNPTFSQKLCIITSALSVPIAHVEKYLDTKDIELGLNMSSMKCFLFFFPHCLYQITAISIFFLF